MKKADIQIGQEYAQHDSFDYGHQKLRSVRVRVTGFGTAKQWTGRQITGALVEWLDEQGNVTDTGAVPNRTIHEEWATYAERRDATLRSRRDAERDRRRRIRERAESLAHLIPALREAGVPDTTTKIYEREEVIPYLEESAPAGLLTKGGDGVLSHRTLTAPLAESIVAYVEKGAAFQVDAQTLLLLTTPNRK